MRGDKPQSELSVFKHVSITATVLLKATLEQKYVSVLEKICRKSNLNYGLRMKVGVLEIRTSDHVFGTSRTVSAGSLAALAAEVSTVYGPARLSARVPSEQRAAHRRVSSPRRARFHS